LEDLLLASVQLELFEDIEVEERYEDGSLRPIGWHGRKAGGTDITTEDRLQEAARLVAQGYKPGEIGAALGVGGQQASVLIRKAKEAGLVDVLQASRNKVTREMAERRGRIARGALKIIEKRLNHVNTKDGEEISSRDVNDAFRALDATEFVPSKEQGSPIIQTTGPVGVFTGGEMQRADSVSRKILGE